MPLKTIYNEKLTLSGIMLTTKDSPCLYKLRESVPDAFGWGLDYPPLDRPAPAFLLEHTRHRESKFCSKPIFILTEKQNRARCGWPFFRCYPTAAVFCRSAVPGSVSFAAAASLSFKAGSDPEQRFLSIRTGPPLTPSVGCAAVVEPVAAPFPDSLQFFADTALACLVDLLVAANKQHH